MYIEELVRGKELGLVLPEIFTAFHRFFMGSKRDLNEVLGWKLNWEAVPYVGDDGIKELTVWQLDFDGYFLRESANPPAPFSAAQNTGCSVQRVTAHCSIPLLGAGGWGLSGVLLLPLSFPGSQGLGSCATMCYCHGSMVGDRPGDTAGEWDPGVCVWAIRPPGAALPGLEVVFKSLLRAWVTGTVWPIKSN